MCKKLLVSFSVGSQEEILTANNPQNAVHVCLCAYTVVARCAARSAESSSLAAVGLGPWLSDLVLGGPSEWH